MAEKHLNKIIKTIRCDNGKEYVNKDVRIIQKRRYFNGIFLS